MSSNPTRGIMQIPTVMSLIISRLIASIMDTAAVPGTIGKVPIVILYGTKEITVSEQKMKDFN